MDRRQFLRGTGLMLGVGLTLAACGGKTSTLPKGCERADESLAGPRLVSVGESHRPLPGAVARLLQGPGVGGRYPRAEQPGRYPEGGGGRHGQFRDQLPDRCARGAGGECAGEVRGGDRAAPAQHGHGPQGVRGSRARRIWKGRRLAFPASPPMARSCRRWWRPMAATSPRSSRSMSASISSRR